MTKQHPITPPPELVQLWMSEDAPWDSDSFGVLTCRPSQLRHIATRAAQWGADTELEACCRELEYNFMPDSGSLRAARRTNPLSLKKQALAELEEIMDELHDSTGSAFAAEAIRRALEALDD